MTTLSKSSLTSPVISAAQRKPLAACIAVIFSLAAPEAIATTWAVTSCADSGAGSLRAVVATPTTLSGDTVDLSACSVSGISLTTGAITIAQTSLALQGPATSFTTVTGYYNGSIEPDRVLNHTGSGTLGLNYLRVSYGNASSTTKVGGGCISSNGNVTTSHTQVLECKLTSLSGLEANGGGIYAKGNLIAKYSQIAGNAILGAGTAYGGGAFAGGTISVTNSTINGNTSGRAGGLRANLGANILNSTISGNSATVSTGGLLVTGNATSSLTISDSTISGNTSGNLIGGVESQVPTTVQNSTIAFNTAANLNGGTYSFAPGLHISAIASGALAVNLESSILSNNTYGSSGHEVDFSAAAETGSTITITSNNNLIRSSVGSPQPATVSIQCPLLGPLRNNGGPTLTHALLSHSLAIDAGNNNANLNTDQRDSGYPRVSGPAADIGAYEVQQNDIVFNSGFDGCPVLF